MKLITCRQMSLLAALTVATIEGCAATPVVARNAPGGAVLPASYPAGAGGDAARQVDFQPIEQGRCTPDLTGWFVDKAAAIRILKARARDKAACNLQIAQLELERDLANEIARNTGAALEQADTPFRRYGFWIGLAVGVVVTGAGGIMIWQLLK